MPRPVAPTQSTHSERPPRGPAAALFAPLLLGLALRLWFIHRDPDLSGDALLYGAIARNLLQHGVYGFAGAGAPTLIRLPGYPLFLALCFSVFGVGHYYPLLYLQALLDLAGCVVLSRLAARLVPRAQSAHAATLTLWLAALCPFTACYTAAPLTETLELLSISTALLWFARALGIGESSPADTLPRARWVWASAFAWIAAAMLRPDGALLGVVLCPALVFYSLRNARGDRLRVRRVLLLAGGAALVSLVAFVPWTLRNWHTFHVFQPLAPRYATDPGEPTHPGFQQWTKTVCADLACTAEVYWAADDDRIGIDELPSRAFDSPQQEQATADLLADYNRHTTITPVLDARFAALAQQRLHDHPVRYGVGMPLLRLADMWFRPRVALFNIDLRWWRYRQEGPDTVLAGALAVLNAAYLLLACAGALRRPALLGAFLAFVALRCALLLTIEAPEPRYTLECYPIILVLAGMALAHVTAPRAQLTYESPASSAAASA